MNVLPSIILDFDSTFIRSEALDELAAICLATHPNKDADLAQIQELTRAGMNGELSFAESLNKRLALFQPTHESIERLIEVLYDDISPSIRRNREFFVENASKIWIISGGFEEYIRPVVASYGIAADHVMANRFLSDSEGNITGIDQTRMMSQDHGKVAVVTSLQLARPIIVVGDGMTDAKISLDGAADEFYAFTENQERPSVVEQATAVVPSFDELLYRLKVPGAVSYPKNRLKVLLLEKIHPEAVELFQDEGYTVETENRALTESELLERIHDVSILGIRSKTTLTEKVLRNAPRLQAIGAYCIGTNQVDHATAKENGIALWNAPYSNTRSVVELTIASIISLMRQLTDQSSKMHRGIWQKSASGAFEVRGKKLGLVGYGNIGSQVSILAEALGMEVIFYDIEERLALGTARPVRSLRKLLKHADVVSIHVDGRSENTNLIGAEEINQMKDGAYIINYSRGSIVEMDALVDALTKKKLGGAAVDVFPDEPTANTDQYDTPLQGLSNVILTPHIGGSTQEAQQQIGQFVTKKLLKFIDTGESSLCLTLPQVSLPPLADAYRILHIHENRPGMLAQMNQIFADHGVNVEGQYLKTNESIGYVISDINSKVERSVVTALKAVPGTIRVRLLYELPESEDDDADR